MSNDWNQGNKLMVSNPNPISPIKLSELNIPEKVLKNFNVSLDLILMGVSEKSHLIQKDFVFFALPGTKTHGANFAAQAVSRGATLVVSDRQGQAIIKKMGLHVPIFVLEKPREMLSSFAASFFKNKPPCIIGVTGTNGKTSVTHYIRQIWEFLGKTAASIGTTGVDGMIDLRLDHTTPDTVKIHWLLNQMANQGINHVAIEASSHGLLQRRLHGIKFLVGSFTNLTRDHFDYHNNIESYFEAKCILFERLIHENGGAVVCVDDDYGCRILDIAKSNSSKIVTVGKNKCADIRILSQAFNAEGQKLKFSWKDEEYIISLPLFGDFQAQNILLTLGILEICGENCKEVINLLERLKPVPGRMEEVAIKKNGARIFVDYAHTPDALEAALRSIRSHFLGKVHLVFGAGGDRDRGKRALMGKVSSNYSDNVIITDDNPRTENPATIRSEIKKFCPKAIEIGDRAEAILTGIDRLKSGDALIIAGKGHEKTQTFASSTFPFNDAEQASLSVQALDMNPS